MSSSDRISKFKESLLRRPSSRGERGSEFENSDRMDTKANVNQRSKHRNAMQTRSRRYIHHDDEGDDGGLFRIGDLLTVNSSTSNTSSTRYEIFEHNAEDNFSHIDTDDIKQGEFGKKEGTSEVPKSRPTILSKQRQ